MTPYILAGLVMFNAAVTEFRQKWVPDARILVAVQPGDSVDAYAWTKCVPESGVFTIEASADLLAMEPERIRWAAAHEIAHVKLHGKLLCDGAAIPGAFITPKRRHEMETQANQYVVETMAVLW